MQGENITSNRGPLSGPGAAEHSNGRCPEYSRTPVPSFNSRPPARLKRPACALRQRGGVNGFIGWAANVGKLAVFFLSRGSHQRVAGAVQCRPAASVSTSFHDWCR